MNGKILTNISIRKAFLSLILAIITQLWYSLMVSIINDLQVLFTINPAIGIAASMTLWGVLAILYQLIYSDRFQWVTYIPVWIIVSLVTKLPISDRGCLINPNVYANSDLPMAAVYILYVLIELIIWSVLMFFAGLIIHAIRKGVLSRKLRSPYPALDDNENSTKRKSKPLWCRLAFSAIDALIMAIPVISLVLNASLEIDRYVCEFLKVERKGFEGIEIYFLIIGICGIVIIAYTAIRVLLTVLMHQSYRSYLASLPFYILSGVAVWLTAPVGFSGWQYNVPLIWDFYRLNFSLYSLTSSSKLFFAVSYILQWFIVISLVFAVKAFIKYCNRQFIKESLERKKNS